MDKTIKSLIILGLATLAITILVWLPFLLKLQNFYGLNFSQGFNSIYRNYDGVEYIAIAKTFYDPTALSNFPLNQSANYYASHFPAYPLIISLAAPFVGFLKSMLLVSLVATILSAWVFYRILTEFKLTKQPLWLSILFLVLPARWLIVHSVGSPEPLFILFLLGLIYYLLKFESSRKSIFIWLSGMCGLFAEVTRPPGILIFGGLGLYLLWKFIKKPSFEVFKYYPLLLIPIGLLAVFGVFGLTYGDFFAYFHSGDNIHLTFPPFQVFNKNQYWVGDIWLEDIVYIFILGFSGGLILFKKKLYPLAFISLTYLAAALLVAHRDISRYTLPIAPLILIAFEEFLTSKIFKIVMVVMILGIYLYAENFLINNTAPIANLGIFN